MENRPRSVKQSAIGFPATLLPGQCLAAVWQAAVALVWHLSAWRFHTNFVNKPLTNLRDVMMSTHLGGDSARTATCEDLDIALRGTAALFFLWNVSSILQRSIKVFALQYYMAFWKLSCRMSWVKRTIIIGTYGNSRICHRLQSQQVYDMQDFFGTFATAGIRFDASAHFIESN